MPARKKRRPVAETIVATPAVNIVEPAAPAAAVSVQEPAAPRTARRPRAGLFDALAFPFEVAVMICLLPFGRRSGAR